MAYLDGEDSKRSLLRLAFLKNPYNFCRSQSFKANGNKDYWKFCKLARDGQLEMESKSGMNKRPGFIELNPDGTHSPATAEELLKVCEIKIRFNNGLVFSRRGGDVEEVISAIRKILI